MATAIYGRRRSTHRSSAPLLIVLLFLILLFSPSHCFNYNAQKSDDLEEKLRFRRSNGGPERRLNLITAAQRAADCKEIGSKEECGKNRKQCKWCVSDEIDDMCFSVAEAWRLPRQVFVCL